MDFEDRLPMPLLEDNREHKDFQGLIAVRTQFLQAKSFSYNWNLQVVLRGRSQITVGKLAPPART